MPYKTLLTLPSTYVYNQWKSDVPQDLVKATCCEPYFTEKALPAHEKDELLHGFV